MRERSWYDKNRDRLKAGLPERRPNTIIFDSIEELELLFKTEWVPQFDILAKQKMVQAAFRYGLLTLNNSYDFIEAMKNKIARYEQTHNLELLVDIRNYAMLEFKKPKDADAYYFNEDDTEHAPLKTK